MTTPITDESAALAESEREMRVELQAQVNRLESVIAVLKQQAANHQRNELESLEHVRTACRQRDEARAERDDSEANLLQARRALAETEKDMGASLSIQTQLRKECDKAKQALSDIANDAPVQCLVAHLHEGTLECDATKPCLACLASAQMQGLRTDLEQARESLRQADRDIATAIERARVAEAHKELAKKERDEAREQLRLFRLDKDTTAHVNRYLPNGQTRGPVYAIGGSGSGRECCQGGERSYGRCHGCTQ